MATFYNQATLSYNGNVVLSNITTGEILDTVSATKTAISEFYSQGSDISYTISIINTGNTNLTGLTVTDNLGSYCFGEPECDAVPLTYDEGTARFFIDGVRQPDPIISSVQPLTFTGISVPAGGSAMIMYEAAVNQFAPYGSCARITNTAEVIGAGGTVLASASATITPEEGAELSISKTLSPVTVSDNDELTYTFVIQNSGTAAVVATDSVIFTDVFEPALNITSVTFNSAPWAENVNYTYNVETGLFTAPEGQITVPPAEFTQDQESVEWNCQPGTSTLIITGTLIS